MHCLISSTLHDLSTESKSPSASNFRRSLLHTCFEAWVYDHHGVPVSAAYKPRQELLSCAVKPALLCLAVQLAAEFVSLLLAVLKL
jgi:hypothetical protein